MHLPKRICLILDNFSVHKSAFIKKIAKILNIELINLSPYSPHLNPIEQLWRIMKNIICNENLKSREHLKELVKKTFKELVGMRSGAKSIFHINDCFFGIKNFMNGNSDGKKFPFGKIWAWRC